jgi:integrase
VFGHLPFADVETEDVTDWVDDQIEGGVAPKTIRNRHGLLSSIMKHGQNRMRLRPDNPCELTELPESVSATSEVRQVRFFQPQEWAMFRSCLDADFRLPMDLDLATGIRWGELSAIRAEDVAFSGKRKHRQANIHIVRAWSRRAPDDPADIKYVEGETATWILGPPKSRRTRWVAATGDVARRLETEVCGRGPDEYIFRTARGCPWRYPDFHTQRWTPARNAAIRAGLTKVIRPHMLRHTTVVWSLARGVPISLTTWMGTPSARDQTTVVWRSM